VGLLAVIPHFFLSDSSAAGNAMKSFITPVMASLVILGTLASTFFLITAALTQAQVITELPSASQ